MVNQDWSLIGTSKNALSFFIIFGGIVPYIPQYFKIRRLKSSDGFSPYVCLTLIIANLLRIGFRFGQPYPTPLLLHSFFMVFGMMFMMYVCVKYRRISSPSARFSYFSEFKWRDFWRWSDYRSYVKFIIFFCLCTGPICFLCSSVFLFVQSVGFVALTTESLLAFPQFLQNYRQSSTVGMSIGMVLLWAVGDFFKTIYFLISKSPVQFLVCGCVQLTLDAAIFLQYLIYKKVPSHLPPET